MKDIKKYKIPLFISSSLLCFIALVFSTKISIEYSSFRVTYFGFALSFFAMLGAFIFSMIKKDNGMLFFGSMFQCFAWAMSDFNLQELKGFSINSAMPVEPLWQHCWLFGLLIAFVISIPLSKVFLRMLCRKKDTVQAKMDGTKAVLGSGIGGGIIILILGSLEYLVFLSVVSILSLVVFCFFYGLALALIARGFSGDFQNEN